MKLILYLILKMTTSNAPWQRGGMTYGGLRDSTMSINYFNHPSRSNLLPDATQSRNSDIISSIGIVETNGLGQIASGAYGPGTLLSTNISVANPTGLTDINIGTIQSSGNKMSFVDYRSTDPVLVNNLRTNPLSIYAQGKDVRYSDIPGFFADVDPENYSTYVNVPDVNISNTTKELYIDDSPNVSILGLAEQNPFMGLGHAVPNTNPIFSGGKQYGGGRTSDANVIASRLYGSVSNPEGQNKALMSFSQGYNIAEQLNENRFVTDGAGTAMPWGPMKITGNPQTQQGGIWQRGINPWPSEYNKGVTTAVDRNPSRVPINNNNSYNPYTRGMPGTLFP